MRRTQKACSSWGAPLDEYDPEIEDLTRLVRHSKVTTESVLAVWERWFGPGSALQSDRALLERLTEDLRRSVGRSTT